MRTDIEEMTEAEVYDFWDFLTNTWRERGARMTRKQAFSVIYYLQESVGVISDQYEMCEHCECLIDSYNESIRYTSDDDNFEADYHFTPGAIELGIRVCSDCARHYETPYYARPENVEDEIAQTQRILAWFAFIDADQAQAHETQAIDAVLEAGA